MRAFPILVLLLLATAFPARAQPMNQLSTQQVGSWSVDCYADRMTDRRTCRMIQRNVSQGVFGASTMSLTLVVFRTGETPGIDVMVPIMVLQHGLTLRIDSQPPADWRCTDVNGDHCTFMGPDAAQFISLLGSGGHALLIRAYTFSHEAHDWSFSLDGFDKAYATLLDTAKRTMSSR